jgi:hypothetical protein
MVLLRSGPVPLDLSHEASSVKGLPVRTYLRLFERDRFTADRASLYYLLCRGTTFDADPTAADHVPQSVSVFVQRILKLFKDSVQFGIFLLAPTNPRYLLPSGYRPKALCLTTRTVL